MKSSPGSASSDFHELIWWPNRYDSHEEEVEHSTAAVAPRRRLQVESLGARLDSQTRKTSSQTGIET
jgi:hypothetical protein